MENTVLGLVLFCVYFCFVCCFFYSSEIRLIPTEIEPKEPIENQIRKMFQIIDEDEEYTPVCYEKVDIDSVEDSEMYTVQETTNLESEQRLDDLLLVVDENKNKCEELLDEEHTETIIKEIIAQPLITALNIEKLTLRKVRPIAKALNIKQKVKGKDLKVGELREQIKQRLQGEPELIPLVYEILEIPFTDRMNTLST